MQEFSAIYQPGRKQFIVVHLIGSHQSYNTKFDAEDYSATSTSPSEYREYDSSIHHTDRVIEAIDSYVGSSPNAIAVYISDHGEIPNVGHGEADLKRQEYEVPFLWFGDPMLVDRFSTIENEFRSQRYSSVNTSALSYMLLELMGWKVNPESMLKVLAERDYIVNGDGTLHPISDLIK
jgi:glucan phosphoethanolaminetransferase (alkaline phosphatase superfamily)